MDQIWVFIIGIFIGAGAVWFLIRKKKEAEKADPKLIEMKRKQAEENRQKILDMLASRQRISNNEVEKALGMSDATAERRLNELEKEGVLKQVGRVGRNVYYEKV